MSDSEEKKPRVAILPYNEIVLLHMSNAVRCDKCKQACPLFDSRLALCKTCTQASLRIIQCFFCKGVAAMAFGDELKRMPEQICCGKCLIAVLYPPSEIIKEKAK